MDNAGGNKKLWAGKLPSSPQGVRWAPDGSGVYYEMEEQGSSHIYFISIDGRTRQITRGTQIIDAFSMANNGQVAGIRTSFKEPGTLVTFNLKDPVNMKTLVDINEDVLAGVRLGTPKRSGSPRKTV